jgi:hypothetical protein
MRITMKNIKKYLVVAAAMAVFGSCELYKLPELPKPTAGTGGLDLTKMVSVGNSLTAGYMNGALYTAGQANSYPSIIAAQMAQAGGGTFNQPDINSTNGFFGTAGPTILGRLRLKLVNGAPTPTPQLPGDLPAPFTGNKAALNNFGVPGVTLQTAQIAALGGPATSNPAYNALYARFASNPSTDGVTGSTLIGDAAAALGNGGTFFTFWLGNNDVLGYATGGASNPTILTTPANFTARLGTALNAMLNAKADAEGAVANIPNVTDIPYFTTINPLAFVVPAASRASLLAGINQLNGAIDAWNAANAANPSAQRPRLSTNFDRYPLIILDPSLPDAVLPGPFTIPKIRNAVAADGILMCLTAASNANALPAGMGISPANPMNEAAHDAFYLTQAEKTEIQAAIDSFNSSIAAAVNSNSSRLVLVDMNTAFKAVAAGTVTVNGSGITASLTPPFGAFSLDGVHPNARGAAYIANLFISAINAKWGSTIPLCNPNNYPSNELPSP